MVRYRRISILGERRVGKLLAEIPDLEALNKKKKLMIYEVDMPKRSRKKDVSKRVSLETKFYACVETGAIR